MIDQYSQVQLSYSFDFTLLTFYLLAHIAQSVEHFLGKEEVTGSNPVMGSRA